MGDRLTTAGVGEGAANVFLNVKGWMGTGKILDFNMPFSETSMDA